MRSNATLILPLGACLKDEPDWGILISPTQHSILYLGSPIGRPALSTIPSAFTTDFSMPSIT